MATIEISEMSCGQVASGGTRENIQRKRYIVRLECPWEGTGVKLESPYGHFVLRPWIAAGGQTWPDCKGYGFAEPTAVVSLTLKQGTGEQNEALRHGMGILGGYSCNWELLLNVPCCRCLPGRLPSHTSFHYLHPGNWWILRTYLQDLIASRLGVTIRVLFREVQVLLQREGAHCCSLSFRVDYYPENEYK